MNKDRFEAMIDMTDFDLMAVKRPKRKKPKFEKLDDNNLIEAEIIKQREKKLLKKLRALG